MIPHSVRPLIQDCFRTFLCISLVFSSIGGISASAAAHTVSVASQSGDVYAAEKSPEGGNVYLDGSNDSLGRTRVWSYIAADGNKPAQYRRGVVDTNGKINWQSIEAAAAPAASAAKPSTANTSGTKASVPANTPTSAPITPAKPNIALKGEAVPSVQSPEGSKVYYDGKLDASGRQVVWSYIPEANGVPASYRYGVLNADGKVQWYNADGSLVATDVDPEFKPSRLREKLNWGAEKTRGVGDILRRIIGGEQKPIEFVDPKAQRSFNDYIRDTDKIQQSKGGQIGAGMITFYIGMGIIAAVTIIRDYPDNPLMLEKYMARLTDPVGWMMLGGFLLVAWPYLSKVNGLSNGKDIVRAVPYFAAGMLAGAVAQGMMTYAMDSDVRKCLGLNSMNQLFTRDMPACDAAYDKLSTEKVTLTFVPAIANLMAGGGIYLGINYISNVAGLTRLLRSVAVMKGPRANAVAMVFTGVVFLGAYEISSEVFHVEKWTRDYLLADHSFSTNIYGGALYGAQSNLYSTYADLKRNKYVDHNSEEAQRRCPILQGDSLIDNSCGFPLDFGGTLKRYAYLQDAWRTNQMAQTMSAYNQWVTKVENYHRLLNASYAAYEEFTSRIQFDLNNPGVSDSDARGFNSVTIRNLEKERTNGSVYKAVPEASGRELSTGLDHDRVVSGGDPVMEMDFSGTWRYVDTTKFYDFIVTSMACGPEGESKLPERGVWQTAQDFGAKWVTHNTSPQQVITDPYGFSIKFFPPRITQPISSDLAATVCEAPTGRGLPNPAFLDPSGKYAPEKFMVNTNIFNRQTPYKNLYSYIEANVRPSVLRDGNSRLKDWWARNVMPQVLVTEKRLRGEFEKMLNGVYKTALRDEDYRDCDAGNLPDLGIDRYLRTLSPFKRACAPELHHRLANGILNSFGDEIRLYLALLIDTHMSSRMDLGPEERVKMENKLLLLAADLTVKADLLFAKMTVVDANKRQDIQKLSESIGLSFVTLKALISPPRHWVRPHEMSGQVQIKNALLENISRLIMSSENYYNMLKTFEMDESQPEDTPKPLPTPPRDPLSPGIKHASAEENAQDLSDGD